MLHRRLLSALLVLLCWCAVARAEVQTFFPGTQYALNVYYLRGAEPGPTVMVQGGIQGDEFCGYLTAQLLTQATVRRGTLIIVPRANPPSVHIRKRTVNVDMNRRFDQDYGEFYEDHLARLVRFLAGQSQGVIHLHEGSGFYNPVRLDDMHGPRRYGQSIVIDAARCGDFQLERAVRQVIAKLNDGLTPEKYKFKLFNQDTFNEHSKWLEQRRSLTYYAMARLGVPALDVEVSKNLVGPYWSWWKVTRQLQATVLFLRAFGVELEAPAARLEDFQAYPPRDVAVLVNGQALDPADPRLALTPGAPLEVRVTGPKQPSPLAPIPCAKASDRAGLNLLEGRRLPLSPFESLAVTADGLPLATVKVTWRGEAKPVPAAQPGDLLCWLNGELKAVPPGETLTAVEGDQLILEGIAGSARAEVLNLKGYVSHPGRDDGQDAGVEIVLDAAMFQKRYVVRQSPAETLCEIVRETPGVNPRPRFLLRLVPRRVEGLVLVDAAGRALNLPWTPGRPLALAPGRYTLKDITGNGPAGKVQAFFGDAPLNLGAALVVPEPAPATSVPRPMDRPMDRPAAHMADKTALVLRQTTTFRTLGAMPLGHAKADAGTGPGTAPQAATLQPAAAPGG
jgi:hypothetical protein